MFAVYGLNLCGVKGRHSFTDRTIILATAYALMGITVNTFKMTASVERPDGSSRNSFPSGHTATAFMGAEFLRKEYWDVSSFPPVGLERKHSRALGLSLCQSVRLIKYGITE